MALWYEHPSVAHRLGHPFVFPGGPSVVAEAAASTRVTVQQFHDQAATAWRQLVASVEHGLNQQVHHGTNHTAQQQEHCNASATQQQAQHDDVLAAQQPHQQHHADWQQQQQPQKQKPPMDLDVSGLAVPLLGRKRLTGPVLLVPQSTSLPGGSAAQPAAAAATAAQQGHKLPMQTLEVPPGCLRLRSWQESAAAKEPPGVVASAPTVPDSASLTTVAAAMDDVLQPGSEVVVTLAVLGTGRRLNAVQQEIQALGSNTLMDVRRIIKCSTDKLAEGLCAFNPAAYFYIDGCFYNDTSATAPIECSEVVEQWLQQTGMPAPKLLLHKFETPDSAARLAVVNTTCEQQQQDGADSKDKHAGYLQPVIGRNHAGEICKGLQPQQAQDKTHNVEDQQQQQQEQIPRRDQDEHYSADMQDVKLHDLVLQSSNRPRSLYSHQGLCEHAIIITDVRLLHAADPSRRSCYPRTVYQAVLARRLHCGVCKRVGASTLILDHPETPEALTMLCNLCCGLFDVEQYPEAKLITFEGY